MEEAKELIMIFLRDEQITLLLELFEKIDPPELDKGRRKFINLLSIDLNTESTHLDQDSDYLNILSAFKDSKSRREQAILCHWGRRFGVPQFFYTADRPERFKTMEITMGEITA